jgi:hypothetical protein
MVRELHFPRAQACGDLNGTANAVGAHGLCVGWSIISARPRAKTTWQSIQSLPISRQAAKRRQYFIAAGGTKIFQLLTEA